MKAIVLSIAAILLSACAATGPGTSGASGGDNASGGGYNSDVREAVTRGSTQGSDPL